jgi:xylulokinase
VLSIDLGATGCKAVLHGADGSTLGRGYLAYELTRTGTGIVELDPQVWRSAAQHAVAAAVAQSGGARPHAVSVTSTNALVLLDAAGRPLAPAVLQMDQRASSQTQKLTLDKDLAAEIVRITRNHPGSRFWLPYLQWFDAYQPEILHCAKWLLYPSGYLIHQLTGVASLDRTRASTTMLFDAEQNQWSSWLTRFAGVAPTQLPPVVSPTTTVGTVSIGAAADFEIAVGTPVIAGCMDSVAGALGAGALDSGDSVAVFGTVGRIGVVDTQPTPAPDAICAPHAIPDAWLNMAICSNTGAILNWLRRLMYATESLDVLGAEAEAAERRGSLGATFSVTTPAGCFEEFEISVGLAQERGDVALAAIRNFADEFVTAYRSHRARGHAVGQITACGGGSNLTSWVSAMAEQLGQPIRVPVNGDTESLGSGMLAAVGCEAFPDIHAAAKSMVGPFRSVGP